ncbi:hypothetical protein V8C86DRAFT_1737666 [Haematococcus lacustris]
MALPCPHSHQLPSSCPAAPACCQASTSVPVPYPSPTPPTGHPQASRLPQPTNGALPGSPNHTASPRPAPLSPAHHSRPTSSGSNSNSSTAPPGHHPTRGLSDGHPAQPVSPFAGSAGGQGGRPPSSGAKDQAAVRYVTQLQSELNTVAAGVWPVAVGRGTPRALDTPSLPPSLPPLWLRCEQAQPRRGWCQDLCVKSLLPPAPAPPFPSSPPHAPSPPPPPPPPSPPRAFHYPA